MAEGSEAKDTTQESAAQTESSAPGHAKHLPPVLVPSSTLGEPEEDAPPAINSVRSPPGRLARERLPDVSPPPIPADSPNEDAPPDSTGPRKEDSNVLLLEQEVENHKANRELRNKYAGKAYDLACGGLVFWGIAISATGIIYGITGRQMLSDKVLIAITTGATVNVLAAFLGVIRGLFPNAAKEKGEKKPSKDGS